MQSYNFFLVLLHLPRLFLQNHSLNSIKTARGMRDNPGIIITFAHTLEYNEKRISYENPYIHLQHDVSRHYFDG